MATFQNLDSQRTSRPIALSVLAILLVIPTLTSNNEPFFEVIKF